MASLRRSSAVLIALLATFASFLAVVSTSTAEAVADSSGGVFVPVTPFRLVDTTNGVGGPATPLGDGVTRDYTVLGQGGIPSTGVAAVVVDISARSSSVIGGSALTAWATGDSRPGVYNMYFSSANTPRSGTSVVKVGTAGQISVYNANGNTHIDVDVQGYFSTTSDAASPGGFVPIDPIRVANSVDGVGVPQAMLAAGASLDVQVSNDEEIPADATGVYANVEVRNATNNGGLKIGPGGASPSSYPTSVTYTDEGPQTSGITLKLSVDGKIRVLNSGTLNPVDFKIDIQGYFTSDAADGGSFVPTSPAAIYSTESTSGATKLAAGATRTIQVSGIGGLPSDGRVGSVVLVLTAAHWTSNGTLSVFNADAEVPAVSNLTFWHQRALPKTSTLAVVRVSDDGRVNVRNTGTAPIDFYLSAQGWFGHPPNDAEAGDETNSDDGGVDLCDPNLASCTPVMVSGKAPGAVQNVEVLAEPADMPNTNQEYSLLELETTQVSTAGSAFSVGVDPSTVPSDYVDENGLVEISVVVAGEDESWETNRTVQAVVDAEDDSAWADPVKAQAAVEPAAITTAGASRTAATGASVITSTLDGTVVPTDGVAVAAQEFAPATEFADTPGATARAMTASNDGPTSHCKVTPLDEYKSPWATIGTTYPYGGDKAKMSVSSSQGATYGIAKGASKWGASYWQSGSKFTKSDWGFSWTSSSSQRSYQKQVKYRMYKRYCELYGVPNEPDPTRYYWKPYNETGGTSSNTGISRPNWTHCANVDAGTWYRSRSDGYSYQYGASVKLAGSIGVDLKIDRQYSGNQKLTYYITGSNKKLCGSNTTPATARKIMEKKR